MGKVRRAALLVGIDERLVDRIAPVFDRSSFFTEALGDGEEALALLTSLPYDAILVRYPLSDVSAHRFLSTARTQGSASRGAAILLIADQAALEEAEGFLGRGANRAVSRDDTPERVLDVIAQLVGAAHRVALRAVSRVQVQLGRGSGQLLCQTENISTSGMLVRTDRAFPNGRKFSFELALPGEDKPIRGLAQVVRATSPRERVTGVGVCFSDLIGDDAARLASYLERMSQ